MSESYDSLTVEMHEYRRMKFDGRWYFTHGCPVDGSMQKGLDDLWEKARRDPNLIESIAGWRRQ